MESKSFLNNLKVCLKNLPSFMMFVKYASSPFWITKSSFCNWLVLKTNLNEWVFWKMCAWRNSVYEFSKTNFRFIFDWNSIFTDETHCSFLNREMFIRKKKDSKTCHSQYLWMVSNKTKMGHPVGIKNQIKIHIYFLIFPFFWVYTYSHQNLNRHKGKIPLNKNLIWTRSHIYQWASTNTFSRKKKKPHTTKTILHNAES